MLIWLNGPFGVGKTTVARALVANVPGALLFDPEELGSMLRKVVSGQERTKDFQDLRAWRELVPHLVQSLRAVYDAPIVMPMTVWRRDYFVALYDGIRRAEPDVHCFRLMASTATLRRRILDHPTNDGTQEWRLAHLAEGLALMRDDFLGDALDTEQRLPEHLAASILQRVNTSPSAEIRAPLFRGEDALLLAVPDLEAALTFYRDELGHPLVWRTATAAGLRIPDSDAELVLDTKRPKQEIDIRVDSADAAAQSLCHLGATVVVEPFDILIGRCAVVDDPWGNRLVLIDGSKGVLDTDASGHVTGLRPRLSG